MVTKTENKEAVKINRRGVSNKTKAAGQLKFHEKDAAQNGLFIGHLESISVEYSKNDDAKSFAGLEIPRLSLHFASNHVNVSEQRHVYYSLFPVESNVDTIVGGKEEWKVNCVFNWIKHVLDVFYLKGRELTEEEEADLSLTFNDSDEEGNYVPVEAEEVIAGYRNVFENAAAMLNGSYNLKDGETAKPVYKTADGKFIPCWMKLIRHKKRKTEWINAGTNGELTFDNFLQSAALELVRKDMPPAIVRLDVSRESIVPKETKKAQAPNIPGMNAMGSVVAGNMTVEEIQSNPAFNAVGGDMPF